jgi:hypothetical protein
MPPPFQAVATKLNELVQGEFNIVPIPNSSATIKDKAEFKTLAHARAVAEVVGARATAVPSLRWKTAKTPLIKAARATPKFTSRFYRLQKPSDQVAFFDDVMTSGSQMIGSYRRLAASGIEPILSSLWPLAEPFTSKRTQ